MKHHLFIFGLCSQTVSIAQQNTIASEGNDSGSGVLKGYSV